MTLADMLVRAIVLAIVGPFFLVGGIVVLEPLVIAFGTITTVFAVWAIRQEVRWFRQQ